MAVKVKTTGFLVGGREGWEDNSVVKNGYCSPRGLMLGVPAPTLHGSQLPGIPAPQGLVFLATTCTYIQVHTHTQISVLKILLKRGRDCVQTRVLRGAGVLSES